MTDTKKLPELVIYHANCDDGFCAAWLHSRMRLARRGEYVAAMYDDDPPDVKGRDVLIFDFSYPRDVLVRMHEEADSLLVFDHHKTAEEALEGLDFCTFAKDKSGARMALEWLVDQLPSSLKDLSRQISPQQVADNWLVDHIETRDLWRFRLPETRRIIAGLRTYPRRLDVWSQIYETGRGALAREGRSILRYQAQMIAAAMSDDNMGYCRIGGRLVPCVNNTLPSITSELVGKMAEETEAEFAAGFFILPTGHAVWNLRSRGDFDVSEIAKQYGGGGHTNAAGFKVPAGEITFSDPKLGVQIVADQAALRRRIAARKAAEK